MCLNLKVLLIGASHNLNRICCPITMYTMSTMMAVCLSLFIECTERCRVTLHDQEVRLSLNLNFLLICVCYNLTLVYCANTMHTIFTVMAMVFIFVGCMERCRVGPEQQVCTFVLFSVCLYIQRLF